LCKPALSPLLYIFVSYLVQQETRDQVYFIKQIESLGNACGTIALIHAVGNSSSGINLGNLKRLHIACKILKDTWNLPFSLPCFWNEWSYLVFCSGEFMLGLILQINC
jgi:hypothetical protein